MAEDRCFEAVVSLIEDVLVKRWFSDLSWIKKATWDDVYHSVRERQLHRVKQILVNIFGEDNYKEKIDDKTLQKLCCIVKEIESHSVAKRKHFLDRSSCCVLALLSIVLEQCQDDSTINKHQIEIVLNTCTNNTVKLRELLSMDNLSSLEDMVTTCCKGMTPIHFAVLWDNIESLQVLLKYVANTELINHKDLYSYTALHYAVQYPSTTAARMLLDYGADVNAQLQFGHTPLHLAAFRVDPKLVLLLCRHGADVSAVTSLGETPLTTATRLGSISRVEHLDLHLTTISLLLRYGSSPNAHDKQGRTPIFYGWRFSQDKRCALMLCSAGANLAFLPKNCTFESNSVIPLNTSQECLMFMFRRFLETVGKTPLRLEIICLIEVRKAMGKSFQQGVQELPLPSKLKQALLFQTLPKLV